MRSSFHLDCPNDFNFSFDIITKKYGKSQKTAIISIDLNGKNVKKISYKELDENSTRFANALLRLGIKKNDKILILLPKIPQWYYAILGCAKIGAVAIPSTTMLKASDLEYRLKKSDTKVIISSSKNSS